MESLEFFHKQRSNKNERKNDMRVYASIIEFFPFFYVQHNRESPHIVPIPIRV